ncbi:spermatogenesis-defective protein 39 homolog [Varroa jacobsoni]|uniref:Vps16 C-terminal domain-containing protein n=1 Tax=Varroa destructor TaxID=109461 RepID=A0A7M7MI00_VARDE|nr:spermatogenesis-defective protein 39 homolog [Varroa destructor]XP_022664954.1 spermatogenesis-defective protein 39 homolog [Varroa destructor]XP_022707398.1 spermatogenesis-defective protein 39 homolog [Varroa jacobsoni]
MSEWDITNTSIPASSRTVPLFRHSSGSFLEFDNLQQQLNSIEGEDEDDPYWNSSYQKGFNFEEDGPTMIAQTPVVSERPKKIEFLPKLQTIPEPELASPLSIRSPKETVEDIFLGNTYSLEQFRSREAKLQLLEAALELGDTPTMQVVVLFLRNSLKPSLFQQELISRPAALQAYLNYLRECGENTELIEQLSLSGHTDEAAQCRYNVIANIEDLKAKIRALATSANTHFLGSTDHGVIKNQLELLQLQAKIQEIDEVTLEINEKILGASLVDTIRYCAKNHAKDPETHFASPAFLKQAFKISADQFTHACVTGYAEAMNYQAIETFLESKNWLGKKKLSSSIGFDKIVFILHQYKAPVEHIEKYIAYIDDVENRINVAKRVGAMNALVNCYVQTKNRLDLEKLIAKLPRESAAAQLVQSSLSDPTIKWNN